MFTFYLLCFFPKLCVCWCQMIFFWQKQHFPLSNAEMDALFPPYPYGNKTSCGELLTALHCVLNLRLNAGGKGWHLLAHLLALVNGGSVFRMFTLLLCTCAYRPPHRWPRRYKMLSQKKKKKGRRHSGGDELEWRHILSRLDAAEGRETTFCDPSATGELHTSSMLIDKSKPVFWHCDL